MNTLDASLDLAALRAVMPEDWPDTWQDMATSLFAELVQTERLPGVQDLQAQTDQPARHEQLAALAMDLTIALANDIGGDTVYIPIGHFLRAGETARKVIATFRGNNLFEVAKVAGVTVSRCRQILRDHQREQFLKTQGRLEL